MSDTFWIELEYLRCSYAISVLFLLSIQADHFTYFLAHDYPHHSSGDRRSQAGTSGQPKSSPIRWQWTFLEGSKTATLRRAYSAAVCGHSPRPRVGRRFPPPSPGLQMKPLRNAHWSPLKHRLSPLFACLLPFLPPTQKAIRSLVRGGVVVPNTNEVCTHQHQCAHSLVGRSSHPN